MSQPCAGVSTVAISIAHADGIGFMANVTTRYEFSASSVSPDAIPTTTTVLLAGGVIGGPLFILAALAQVLTRPGFDLNRHAISMLTLGDRGWMQSANFEITGWLVFACALGMRRVLRSGPGATWGPRLFAGYGL